MAFPEEKAARLEDKLLSAYSANARVTILSLRENTDPELREVADYVYENVFVHYTMKQWGQLPEEIDPATTARVPILLSRDDRYFQDPYQGMPLEGYTPLFQRMLDHPRITVELGVDARERMALEDGVKVYCFTRVRNVDNEPLILETSYYPQHIYPNLTREMLETHSFYSLLYHVGVVPFAAEDSYEAVTLGEYEAKLLGCVPGAAAFHHQRRTTMENGLVYECTSSYMRGDRVRLDVCFQKSGTSFTRVVD